MFFLSIAITTNYTYLHISQSLNPERKAIVITWSLDFNYINMI